ncbi:MAG: three-Cys-motif partner protein TcmP [Acaryochloridaceae cyanobacterium RU_4_10]|nr:three-Cys-motif partner protein TcmP [Acaryochloridaceae cyanobacterium RU_4_10]
MSKTSNFTWSGDGNNPPIVEAHTKARHQVTEEYLKDWIVTLCGNNRAFSKKVTIIDGFCGGGVYRDNETSSLYLGSPFKIISSIEEGLKIVKNTKSKPNYELDAEFIFIDSRKEHIECLQKTLKEYAPETYKQCPDNFKFICNEFENVVDPIIENLRKRNCSSMFILDPTGYNDVSMRSIRNIIALKKSEIIFTFMTEYISRFINLRHGKLKRVHEEILESEGYFDAINLGELGKPEQQGYLRNETLRLFRRQANVPFVFSFALIPNQKIVQYFLVHLASNASAQRVIKSSAWIHNNLWIGKQYGFSMNGMGFKSPDYYEKSLNLFDIEEENRQAAIECLSDFIMPLIHSNEDGILLDLLHQLTMQDNPSTFEHYIQYLLQQRGYGEIEIIREGKATRAQTLRNTDIICKSSQVKLFDLKSFS